MRTEGGVVTTSSFGIWEVDETSKASNRLLEAARASTEQILEDVIVGNPAMLMPGLELVGRQLPTATGSLDLLGVDSEGHLVVFELKREQLTRRAVAQAIDYASWLDSLHESELFGIIVSNSGQRGIDRIQDFEEWYDEHDNWVSIETLRPVRTVLVGLGVDDAAHRMADWLATKGVAIDLLTFRGFRCGDHMFLARQLESSEEAQKERSRSRAPTSRAEKNETRSNAIETKVDEFGMRDWWSDAVSMLERESKPSYRANSAITFYKRRPRTLSTGQKAAGSHKIEIVKQGVIRIVFYPAAVELCEDEFEDLKGVIPFGVEPPPNAPVTENVSEQYFCRLDESGWQEHKDKIATLVREVDARWRKDTE